MYVRQTPNSFAYERYEQALFMFGIGTEQEDQRTTSSRGLLNRSCNASEVIVSFFRRICVPVFLRGTTDVNRRIWYS